jgi:hypothetical protein
MGQATPPVEVVSHWMNLKKPEDTGKLKDK